MKKALLIALAILLAASAVSACESIGLFADLDHGICTISPALYAPFTWYIFALPDLTGFTAVEFMLVPPTTMYVLSATKNPGIVAEQGGLTTGISSTFGECQMGWTLLYTVSSMVTALTPGYVTVVPNPNAQPPAINFATCVPYLHEGRAYNTLGVFQGCQIATKEATWGAIKSLF